MSADFSKIYKRLSTTTWFVRDCYGTLIDVDRDNRWCNRWRCTTKDVSSWWVPLSPCPNKWNNLFLQDAGQNVLCLRQQVSDANLWQPKNLSSIISIARAGPSIGMASAKVASKERAEPF